jgi:hypothetical protein
MASDRQIRANRSNALKSTGPNTSDGRARSAQNAMKAWPDRRDPAAAWRGPGGVRPV